MTTIMSAVASEPTVPPGIVLEEGWGVETGRAGGSTLPEEPPAVAVMGHLVGAVGLVLTSLAAGLLLVLLAPAPAAGGGVLIAGPALSFLWFRWLLRTTKGRRETVEGEEVGAHPATPVGSAPPAGPVAARPSAGKPAPTLGSTSSVVAPG